MRRLIDQTMYGLPSNTRFCDIWDEDVKFVTDYKNSGVYQYGQKERLDDEHMYLLYYLLYSTYGNSSIATNDRNRFKYKVFDIIFQYGPSWVKKLELQNKIRNLTDEDLLKGSKAIYNHAYNPGTEPSTATLTELQAINEQNTTHYTKSKADALALQWELLSNDVTNSFLGKFKQLFIIITAPVFGLAYKEVDEEEDEE